MTSAKKPLLVALIVIVAIYFVYQGRYIVFGPSISITSPLENEVLTGPLVTVTGTAKNVAWLTLNDSPIFTDKKGHFSEKLIVSTGTSIIGVKARDHFGREKEVYIRVTLN